MSEGEVPNHMQEFLGRARIHTKLWSARLDRFYALAHAAGFPDEEISELGLTLADAWLRSRGEKEQKFADEFLKLRFPYQERL